MGRVEQREANALRIGVGDPCDCVEIERGRQKLSAAVAQGFRSSVLVQAAGTGGCSLDAAVCVCVHAGEEATRVCGHAARGALNTRSDCNQ